MEKAAVLDAARAPKGELIPMDYPPVVVKNIYNGKYIGSGIYDLEQNMSGMFEVTVFGHKGDKIRVVPYERLDENGTPAAAVPTRSVYTSADGENTFCPKFSYAGGRWIRVDAPCGNPKICTVRGKFITSASEDIGDFKCSDERINKIFSIIKAVIESNLNHCHTDCPTIERLGRLEPNHLMAPSVMYLKNVNKLWPRNYRRYARRAV